MEVIRQEFGRPWHGRVFAELSSAPIAAASLGQVCFTRHRRFESLCLLQDLAAASSASLKLLPPSLPPDTRQMQA